MQPMSEVLPVKLVRNALSCTALKAIVHMILNTLHSFTVNKTSFIVVIVE